MLGANTIRVLHSICSLEPEYGGPTSILYSLLPELAVCGVESEVVTTVPFTLGTFRRKSYYDEELCAFVHVFSRVHLFGWRYVPGLRKWLELNIRRFDVVHYRALYNYLSYVCSEVSYSSGVPMVFEPQGSVSGWSQNYKKLKKTLYSWFIRGSAVFKANVVLATHQIEKDDYERLSMDGRGNVQIVRPPISLPKCSMSPKVSLTNDKVILYLGRLHPKKGIELLIEALDGLSGQSIRLVLAGSGEPRYVEMLIKKSATLKLQGVTVDFLGHVSGRERELVFRRADIFVLPSWDENFAVAVVESVARGVPVIASTAVAAAFDLEEFGFARLFEPGDIQQLRRLVSSSLADTRWKEYVEHAGFDFSAARYSGRAYARHIVSLYRASVGVTGTLGEGGD